MRERERERERERSGSQIYVFCQVGFVPEAGVERTRADVSELDWFLRFVAAVLFFLAITAVPRSRDLLSDAIEIVLITVIVWTRPT